jgi:hypothetical protein
MVWSSVGFSTPFVELLGFVIHADKAIAQALEQGLVGVIEVHLAVRIGPLMVEVRPDAPA